MEKLKALRERYRTDIRFRTKVWLYLTSVINLLYIAMKLISEISFHSPWFIVLAIYYTLLAGMKLGLARQLNAQNEAAELRCCRSCGFALLVMNQVLVGIVIFIVYENQSFAYPGMLIYAMAVYAFYAVITAVINMVKSRRHSNPVLSAAKAVDLVAAMVAILSLTTALLARFGEDESPVFRRAMTGFAGAFVCIVAFVMAGIMIIRANRKLKKMP